MKTEPLGSQCQLPTCCGGPLLERCEALEHLLSSYSDLGSCFSCNAVKFEIILDFPKGFTYNWMLHSLFLLLLWLKYMGESSLRKEGFLSSRGLATIAHQAEKEHLGNVRQLLRLHPKSEVEMDAGAPFNSVWNPNKQDSATKFRVHFPSQLTEWWSSLTDMPRGLPSRQPWTLSGWQHRIPLFYPLAGPPVLPAGLVDGASKCVLKSTLGWEVSANAIPKGAAHDCGSTTQTRNQQSFSV